MGNSHLDRDARAHSLAKLIALPQNLFHWRALGGNMGDSALGRKRFLGGVTLAVALWAWPASGFAYTMEQQQACMGDAFRLCGSEIPDVSRVTMCMVRRQTELSAGCRVYFKPPETAAVSRPLIHRATRPHRVVRQSRRDDYDD